MDFDKKTMGICFCQIFVHILNQVQIKKYSKCYMQCFLIENALFYLLYHRTDRISALVSMSQIFLYYILFEKIKCEYLQASSMESENKKF